MFEKLGYTREKTEYGEAFMNKEATLFYFFEKTKTVTVRGMHTFSPEIINAIYHEMKNLGWIDNRQLAADKLKELWSD